VNRWSPAEPAKTPTTPNGVLSGGFRNVLAESLFMPTGLIAVIYLARRLGMDGYATFALAFAIVSPLEWIVTGPFSAATVRAVSTTEHWRAVGLVSAHRQFLLGLVVAIGLIIAAPLVVAVLASPMLLPPLRLFALDIPLFALAQGYRDILVGRGLDRERTLGNAGRMIARPLLIVLLVEVGFGVNGAVLGTIGVSIVHALLSWSVTRGPLRSPGLLVPPTLSADAASRALTGFGLRIFERLDLLVLAAVGTTVATSGIVVGPYGTAQFLTLLPGTIALAFMPQLESALRHQLQAGGEIATREVARTALRVAVMIWPFAGLAAGAAPRLVRLFFGDSYTAAATPLALLTLAAAATILLIVATTLLTARDRTNLTLVATLLLPLLTLGGHLIAVPRWGANGAALVTTSAAGVVAVVAVVAALGAWRLSLPSRTVLRAVLLSSAAYIVARVWEVPIVLLPVQLAFLCVLIVAGFIVLREVRPGELL
jgi:O-antigen/teichoic acid export membrane protein